MQSAADSPSRVAKRLRWVWLAFGTVMVAGLGALADWRDSHMLLINRSDSLPNWAFLVSTSTRPSRGAYIAFFAPRSPLVARHFGEAGPIWAKIVYGMPGDEVLHDGPLVTINGEKIARLKTHTRSGEVLTPGPRGRIPSGCFYAGTPHADGFDSRYADIGFICGRQIIGVGTTIL